MTGSKNVLVLASKEQRGEAAAQHAMMKWRPYVKPPKEHSPGGFAACLNIVCQGPTHSEYALAFKDLCEWATINTGGKEYRIADRPEAIYGYIPGTAEAKALKL